MRSIALLLGLLACAPSTGGLSLHPGRDSAGAPADSAPAEEVEEIEGVEALGLTISPPGAVFDGELEVQVEAAEGVRLHYTLDGALPTERSPELDGPLRLTENAELRVLARRERDDLRAFGAASFLRARGAARSFTSNLPLMVLSTRGALPEDDEVYVPAALLVMEPGDDGRARLVGPASTTARAAFKVRGSSSAGYPKKSYALELWSAEADADHDAPLLGLPEDSDWVLYAPLNFDRALMRNALVYALSERVGRYAPRTRFVELFGAPDDGTLGEEDYLGVYVLIERIGRGAGRVDIARLDPTDVEPPEVTGGYLFKRDRLGDDESGFTAGTAGGTWVFSQPLVYVDPREEEIVDAQVDYLIEAIDAFGEALAGPGFRHPVDGSHYDTHIDVGAWIDHHVLNLYAKNPDAFRLSGYLYKDRGGPIHAGPVWDFDRTMGCAADSRAQDPTWWDPSNITSDTTYLFEHGWYRGLFSDPDFAAAYWARLEALLAAELSVEAVHALIDTMAAELAEAAPRNFARWPDYPPRGEGTHAAEVQLLKDWVSQRHAWMSACLDAHPDDPRRCRGG